MARQLNKLALYARSTGKVTGIRCVTTERDGYDSVTNEQPIRWSIEVRGIVQGVGFRPFVKRLADQYGIDGFVQNVGDSVLIEGEGPTERLTQFLNGVRSACPAAATIDEIRHEVRAIRGECQFVFKESESPSERLSFIPTDTATCDECLQDLWNPTDRRYEYPFLNCAHCGPRWTMIESVPYDRDRTSMAGFPMCRSCRSEFENPRDRRFHAQAIACPDCGPQLRLLDGTGAEITAGDPLRLAAQALLQAQIVAVKGLGGFHLSCDAGNESAVQRLRNRKQRDEQPLAIMVRDLESAERVAEFTLEERDLLFSSERPIVLVKQRFESGVAAAVGLGNPRLGVLLPYTPLHHLLLRYVNGRPLVMTSGNRGGEPIAFRDSAAHHGLSGIADLVLTHNRPIQLRCDDSVTRHLAGAESPVRRSRGHVPRPLPLPVRCRRQTLALGGELKSTFALGIDRHAILSQHLGDLKYLEAARSFRKSIQHFQRLFQFRPQRVAHDLHPDYESTQFATEQFAGVERIAVQHHHAHMASCMAENGLVEPVIGVIWDGSGLGPDGGIWGGEFLVGDYAGFRRAAHFRYVPLPGGEQAIRQPWRMAASHLQDARVALDGWFPNLPDGVLTQLRTYLQCGQNIPFTSSVGRLFDAVAALAGVRLASSYEGQAAIELEWQAELAESQEPYSFNIAAATIDGGTSSYVVDTRPLIVDVAREVQERRPIPAIARRFHSTLATVVSVMCRQLRADFGLDAVVLSGGVFLNAMLLQETLDRLRRDGFRVYRHCRVPANDGGLCLGQLAIAATCDRGTEH